MPDAATESLYQVRYGGSRLVPASDVRLTLAGDQDAIRRVDEAVLLKKAKPWAYEREWRLIGPRGERDSPLELEEVIFGMRCPTSVKFAVVKALEGRSRAVRFFEIREQWGSFVLVKRSVDLGEMLALLPRRGRDLDPFLENLEEIPD